MSAEKYLIKYLLDNYEHVGVVGRPVFNTSETINVSYGIGLIQVLNLDEKNQILTALDSSRFSTSTRRTRSSQPTSGAAMLVRL